MWQISREVLIGNYARLIGQKCLFRNSTAQNDISTGARSPEGLPDCSGHQWQGVQHVWNSPLPGDRADRQGRPPRPCARPGRLRHRRRGRRPCQAELVTSRSHLSLLLFSCRNDGAATRRCRLTGGLEREFSIPVGSLCRESHGLHAGASLPNETESLAASCFH